MNAISSRLRHLLRDQAGTTITEFVIVLPVFLLIFAGIGRMYALQSTSTAIQLRATHQMWSHALETQRQQDTNAFSGSVNHAHIALAADAAQRLSQAPQATPAQVKGFMSQRWSSLKRGGSIAEISLIHDRIRPMVRDFNLDEFDQTLSSAAGSPNLNFEAPPTTHTQLVSTAMAQRLFDETASLTPVVAAGPSRDTFFTPLRTVNTSRPVAAANLRYGLAHAQAQDTVDIFGVPIELSTGFDVLVSPVSARDPAQPGLARAVVRNTLETQDLYNTLLSIETPKAFRFDASY